MIRLTGRGTAILCGGVVLGGSGMLLGYPVLIGVAAAALGAVLAAVVVATRRPHIDVARNVHPDRVQRGRPAIAQLRVHNTGTRWQAGFVALDRVGGSFRSVVVRALPPNADAVYHYELPTEVRGRHEVGPLAVQRADPLGLGHSRLTEGQTATLWVHPRVYPIKAFADGLPRHHYEGATTDKSLRGSLDLCQVREYTPGDELRHVHWKASARTGALMVREYIDPIQPRFTALLDTRPGSHFESAIDLVASLVVAAAGAGYRCRLVTSCGADLSTSGAAGAARELLDLLCLLRPAESATLPLVPDALRDGGGGSIVTVLSALSESDRTALARLHKQYSAMVVIALGSQQTARIPGDRLLVAENAEDAASRWNMVMAS